MRSLTSATGKTTACAWRSQPWGSPVEFLGPQRVKIAGRVNDICPKDGYAAYIEFKLNFADGGYATRVISDQRKCKAAAKSFSFTMARHGSFVGRLRRRDGETWRAHRERG